MKDALSKIETGCFSDMPSVINGGLTEKELSAKFSSMEGVPLRSWSGAYSCHPGFTITSNTS
jgi:hypothetical protein